LASQQQSALHDVSRQG